MLCLIRPLPRRLCLLIRRLCPFSPVLALLPRAFERQIKRARNLLQRAHSVLLPALERQYLRPVLIDGVVHGVLLEPLHKVHDKVAHLLRKASVLRHKRVYGALVAPYARQRLSHDFLCGRAVVDHDVLRSVFCAALGNRVLKAEAIGLAQFVNDHLLHDAVAGIVPVLQVMHQLVRANLHIGLIGRVQRHLDSVAALIDGVRLAALYAVDDLDFNAIVPPQLVQYADLAFLLAVQLLRRIAALHAALRRFCLVGHIGLDLLAVLFVHTL